jgi:hypothetical protein
MKWLAMAGALFVCACGDNQLRPPDAGPADAAPDVPIDANPLASLMGTGLCLDAACQQISPDVHEYVPRFTLWADTATKRRWIFLPPGTTIDTTDMNHWVFPVGTKIWKEFTRDNIRVETRLILKQKADDSAPNSWFFVSYEWNAAQDATTAVPMGVMNANGTQHDIPGRGACRECHESEPSRVLGFQAIQLDYTATSNLLDLDKLGAMGLLTVKPTGAASPHFPIAGNATTVAAVGYLHANCRHCHNPASTVHDMTPMDLTLDVTKVGSVATMPAFVTAVDVNASIPFFDPPVGGTEYKKIIISGDPDNSGLIVRMTTTNPLRHMPHIASELVDPDGQTQLRAWINSL